MVVGGEEIQESLPLLRWKVGWSEHISEFLAVIDVVTLLKCDSCSDLALTEVVSSDLQA